MSLFAQYQLVQFTKLGALVRDNLAVLGHCGRKIIACGVKHYLAVKIQFVVLECDI